jgi:DNA polymerase-3 subunit epsilon
MRPPIDDLEVTAQQLEASGRFRVLRKLQPHALSATAPTTEKLGIVLDFETTGLDYKKDEIIEIGMVKFRYSAADEITGVSAVFSAFNQPAIPIPSEITELTGITDQMVQGQSIDAASLESFIADASIVIAHNAKFDRPFAEKSWRAFERKPWACTATQVDWRKHGFAGSRLAYLLAGIGYFHEAHRAIDDCHALLEVLAYPLPKTEKSVLGEVFAQARQNTARIWAQGAPFDLKDKLKQRKYRWNDGSDGRPKSWHIDIEEHLHENELKFLREEIFQREVDIPVQIFSAIDRFSTRG